MTKEILEVNKEEAFVAVVASEGKDGKTYWHSLGRAFPNKAKDGSFLLNIPSMNIVVMKQKEKPQNASSANGQPTQGATSQETSAGVEA
ncbi:MAG: hypothetical protein JJ975_05900 [Bacteroidia bacterium]|nr:hypothetical protein [Bacteroidia bacterium]